MAARLPDGKVLVAAPYRRDSITLFTWLRRWGLRRLLRMKVSCAANDWVAPCNITGASVGFVRDPRAPEDDCSIADLVLSSVPVRSNCPSAQLLIDRFYLWHRDAMAARWQDGMISVEGA